ncbi:hypothetical protein C8J56DRAFT_981376 [Mycena floridula]|nr:hypothetical protein C8J56DRAFT_981376 [Mycena floridula]
MSAPGPRETYGPLLGGAFLSTLLYGVTLVQVFIYLEGSKRDPRWMRLLVFYLFFAETINTGFNFLLVYQPLILDFGTMGTDVPFFLRTDGALTVAISTPVQLFTIWRITILNNSKTPAIVVGPMALLAFIGGIWTSISISIRPALATLSQDLAPPTTWLVASAVTDVTITVYLVRSLSKKRINFDSVDNYLSRIIRLTIQTGAFTALAAFLDALVFLSVKNTTVFFIWDLSLSKLYLNAMLSSMNARHMWKAERNILFDSASKDLGSSITLSRLTPLPSHYSSPYPFSSDARLDPQNKKSLDLGRELH